MTAETIRDRGGLRSAPRHGGGQVRPPDVVVVDDVMRILDAEAVGAAQDNGTKFIGLWDPVAGKGQAYLVDLGVDLVLPASVTAEEIIVEIRRLGPKDAAVTVQASARPRVDGARSGPGRRGALTVLSRVSGGLGATEVGIAMTERLNRDHRVLYIEADELGPTAAERLKRDPDFGLARALGRINHGHPALPDSISPPRRDGRALGRADYICGTVVPGGPPIMSPAELVALADEALGIYEEVLIETNVLVAGSAESGRDRFAAGRAVLARADRIVVLAGPDLDGATRLMNWLPAAHSAEAVAPVWAVFGPRRRQKRFERAQLEDTLVDRLGGEAFAGVHFLPYDRGVPKARWNAELVPRGRWLKSVDRLAVEVRRSPPVVHGDPVSAAHSTVEAVR